MAFGGVRLKNRRPQEITEELKLMEVILYIKWMNTRISLLHFDDGIKDECGRTWVSNGGATVSTDQKVYGNSSLALDVGKYIYTDDTTAFDFTGEFTIEMWAMLRNCLRTVWRPFFLNTNLLEVIFSEIVRVQFNEIGS